MRLLLDTHAFLWWIGGDRRLSVRAREAVAEPGSDVVVSVVSVWEIAIKAGQGQLELPTDLRRFLREELARNQFEFCR